MCIFTREFCVLYVFVHAQVHLCLCIAHRNVPRLSLYTWNTCEHVFTRSGWEVSITLVWLPCLPSPWGVAYLVTDVAEDPPALQAPGREPKVKMWRPQAGLLPSEWKVEVRPCCWACCHYPLPCPSAPCCEWPLLDQAPS